MLGEDALQDDVAIGVEELANLSRFGVGGGACDCQ